LKEGIKFCTQCGEKFKGKASLILPIISITLTVIWIMAGLILVILREHSLFRFSSLFGNNLQPLSFIAILLALIAQNKQKSPISFLAGVIPTICLIIDHFYWLYWL